MRQFRLATDKLKQVEDELSTRGFKQQKACVSDNELAGQILINIEAKTFYYLDDECLKETKETVRDYYGQSIENITVKTIRKWN